ncbi:hypothetical protein ACFLS9_02175 [Bacteroidota bacterium]
MKKILNIWPIILIILFTVSCELPSDDEVVDDTTDGEVILTGRVIQATSGNPMQNAVIKVTDGAAIKGGTTDELGWYTVYFDLSGEPELTLIASAEGYTPDTTIVTGVVDQIISVPTLKLKQEQGSGSSQSGKPASIYLYSQSAQSVVVKESGGLEAVQIVYEIMDSSGVAINIDNSATVEFSFGFSPGGGEYLYPLSVKTDALGRASVTLNSGTIAGVVQIIATLNAENGVIKSKPILIGIHGGFPDQNHFHVASEKLNYPALGIVGFEIDFTAFVGDKFTNPVRPFTAVYFETTSGIIDGSNLTDNLGRATVTLLTQPSPNHPVYGPGFFIVTARTINENEAEITTETLRLQSGFPIISVNPTYFEIPFGGIVPFAYSIHDVNNNPLAEGNSYTVSVKGEDVEVQGDVSIELPDTQYGFKNFSFVAINIADSVKTRNVSITVSSSGPNGRSSVSVTGLAY